jgi:hypothetical protein
VLTPATHRLLAGLVGLGLAGLLGGCNVVGWVGQSLGSDEPPPVLVKAEYTNLDNQTVAVLVDADLATLYAHPAAQLEVCSAVTNRIAANVPGVSVIDPQQVISFQQRNIYWSTAAYSELAEKLGATRLIFVDLTEFRMHEPGNVHIFRGVITASVGVAETDGPNPDDLAYANVVSATYPPGSSVGVPEGDLATIRKATLDLFARAVAGKFYDHQERRP